jgi:diguanylate cyclase (GGDEF)-like protein
MSDDHSVPQPAALIVDDDPTMRMLARQVLEQIGLEVEEAGDGQEAIRLFKQIRPAIVLLDVLMPVMDGFEACHAIRHLPGGTHTPILIMTGLDDIESIERAYEVGATDFIAKPWQILILSHRVRYMLRTGRVLEALRDSQAGLARAQQLAHLGSWTWTLRTNQFTVSDEVFRILALSPHQFDWTPEAYLRNVHPDDQELVRQSLEEALALRREYEVDYRIIRPGGEERIVTERGAPSCDEQGRVLTVTGTIQDITVRRNAEAQMFLSTFYDRLTNLPNRLLFEERLRQAVESAQQTGEAGAVLVLNLNHFRRINETMGLIAGDEVLHAVADRLQACVRKGDGLTGLTHHPSSYTLARLVADTFSILMPHLRNPRDAAKMARRLLTAIQHPFSIGQKDITLSASIGVTLFPSNAGDVPTLLQQADAALQSAKAKGGTRFVYFTTDLSANQAERLGLEADLRRALQQNEFVLHYQPQVDVKKWAIRGVEAFLRWRHPTRGLLGPAQFLSCADEAGLTVAIGEWVIGAACRQQKAWQEAGLPPVRVAVNLSPAHFRHQGLVEMISLAVQDMGRSPEYLELEVTESMVMQDLDHSLKVLKHLKALGVRIALDDFGTGFTSLRELRLLPMDTVKIDHSFIQDASATEGSAGFTAALITLAHSLKCRAIAEGVETQAQLEALQRAGCEEVQGFLYSPPRTAEETTQLLTKKPDPQARNRPAA